MDKSKLINIGKIQQWITELEHYDYGGMGRDLQKWNGDLPPCDREAMIEEKKIINKGKIEAYKQVLILAKDSNSKWRESFQPSDS